MKMPKKSEARVSAVIEHIFTSLAAADLAVFCGAGISRNSGQPVAQELERYVLTALRIPEDDQRLLLGSNLPFEAFVETMALMGPMDDIYKIFTLGEPNATHRLLARLMKIGKLRTVATTNFDLLLERALEEEAMYPGVDYRLAYRDEHFAATDWSESQPRLIKIHGSAHDFAGMAMTIERVARRIDSPAARSVVESLFSTGLHKAVLILGYSCSDLFDITPQILAMSQRRKRVTIVQHDTSIAAEQLGNQQSKNPFRAFRSGNRLHYPTDKLIDQIRDAYAVDKGADARPELVNWHAHVDRWIDRDPFASFRAHRFAGILFSATGDSGSAIRYAEAAYAEAILIGDPDIEALAAHDLGNLRHRDGDLEGAETAYSIASSYADERSPSDPSDFARLLISKKRFLDALDAAQACLETAVARGDRHRQADALQMLGTIAQSTGAMDEACSRYTAAHDIYREVGNIEGQTLALIDLGRAFISLGDAHKALEYYARACELAIASGQRANEADIAYLIGIAHRKTGQRPLGQGAFKHAAELYRELSDPIHEAAALMELGADLMKGGSFAFARDFLSRACQLIDAFPAKVLSRIECHAHLAPAYLVTGDQAKAVAESNLVLDLADPLQGREKGQALVLASGMLMKTFDPSRALECATVAAQTAREVSDADLERHAMELVDWIQKYQLRRNQRD